MRTWFAVLALMSVAASATAAELSVTLTDAPRQIRLPLAEGENVILTARVEGEARSVWLARGRDARARYLLDRVGKGLYQVNLADPVLSAMLEAAGTGQVQVFAESPDGTVSASIRLRYGVRPKVVWRRPPRIFVKTGQKTTEVTGRPLGWGPGQPALMVELRGQGLAMSVPGLGGLPFGPGSSEVKAWFEPSEVDLIEVRFASDAEAIAARASTGDQQWDLRQAESRTSTRELVVTDAVRRAWERDGRLTVTCSQEGSDDLVAVLKAPPRKLDLRKDEGRIVIVQRFTEDVPGSDGYLRVHIGDIAGAETLLTLRTAGGRVLVNRRSVSQGDSVTFRLGEHEYDLTLAKLVNLLVGDDYAEFLVAPHAAEPEPAPEIP